MQYCKQNRSFVRWLKIMKITTKSFIGGCSHLSFFVVHNVCCAVHILDLRSVSMRGILAPKKVNWSAPITQASNSTVVFSTHLLPKTNRGIYLFELVLIVYKRQFQSKPFLILILKYFTVYSTFKLLRRWQVYTEC